MRPQATSEAITFKPIKIYIRYASQNDCLNFSFVKDEHTYGKKSARNGRTTSYLSETFISKQSLTQWTFLERSQQFQIQLI